MEKWPALIAAVTDLDGKITGAHRTWLARDGADKAPIETPRKAMGELLGHAVRFGAAYDILAAGEGIETMLSLRSAMPNMPVIAALSAAHLAALLLPPTLRRVHVALDNDPAGRAALNRLSHRANLAEIKPSCWPLDGEDFNEDLRQHGLQWLRTWLANQLLEEDRAPFLLDGYPAIHAGA